MAQEELIKRFLENRDALMGFIVALTRDHDAAEEIFQNVAVTILGEAGRAAAVGNFLGWAREIARHRAADYYRRQARVSARERPSGTMIEVISQAFAENETAPHAAQTRMRFLLECVGRLSGRSRDVIEGFYRERKSLKELAAALAWQVNSVKVALSRARKALADCVETRVRAQEAG
jgi:RNA polymerase sigma-70 factor (ECF subfamily)